MPAEAPPATVATRRPFVATRHFLHDFALVWHRRPRCYFCRRLIRRGELVGWLRSWHPETVHHPSCREAQA